MPTGWVPRGRCTPLPAGRSYWQSELLARGGGSHRRSRPVDVGEWRNMGGCRGRGEATHATRHHGDHPYNAQVFEIQQRLPGARVGTVDKFQGQEAPIAIYSTATSSHADAPRGMEFLDSLNLAQRRHVEGEVLVEFWPVRRYCSRPNVAHPGKFDLPKCVLPVPGDGRADPGAGFGGRRSLNERSAERMVPPARK